MFAVPNRPRLYRRLALGVLAVAAIVFVATALFGILMPVEWGHYGHHLGEYILRARGTLRHHTMIPTQWAGPDFPPISSYYLHHGILPHHFLTVVIALFGEHLWLVRLVPITWCTLSLIAIFVVLRRHWSNRAAAAGAITYATLAYTGSFVFHYDEGQLALPAFLIAADAWLRYRQTPRFHLAAAAVAGFAIGGMSEWTPYFNTAIFVPIAFLIGFSHADKRFRTTLLLRPSQWVAFFIGLSMVVVLAFHFWFTWKVGAFDDLMVAYGNRTSNPSWEFTIDRQHTWILMYFGKPFLWLAAVWALLLFGRAVSLRTSARDLLPLTLVGAWILDVLFFPTGLNIHAYRVLPLSGFFPIIVGDLVHRLPAILRFILDRLPLLRRTAGVFPAVAALASVAWLLKVQIPPTVSTIREARKKAGTIEFEGYSAHLDAFFFAAQMRLRTPDNALVIVHSSLGVRPEFQMICDREVIQAYSLATGEAPPPSRGRPMFVAWDNDWIGQHDRPVAARLVARHGAFMIDRFVLVDLSSDRPQAETYQFEYRTATRAFKYFVSWDYPPMLSREGTRPSDAAWLGSLGVKVVTRNDVPEPAANDLPGLVGYVNYLRVRGDDPAALQRTEQSLRKLTQPGPVVGPFELTGWYASGRDMRLVLAQGPDDKDRKDLRVLFTPIEEPSRPAQNGRRPVVARREPMLRSPVPMRTEWEQQFWKKGLLYLWDVPTNDLDRGNWTASALLFEGGKAPPPTAKSTRLGFTIPHSPRKDGSPAQPPAPPLRDKRPAAPEPAPAPPPPPAEPLQKSPIGTVRL